MKSVFSQIFFQLFVILLSIQAYAQKPFIELSVSTEEVSVGEQLMFTAKSNLGGNIAIEFPSDFEKGYSMINGMKQEIDYTSGRFVSLYYVSKDGTFEKPGVYTVGPAVISRGGKTYKSNLITIRVVKGNSQSSQGSNTVNPSVSNQKSPAFGVIKLSKQKVYEGEPLTATAHIYARFHPTHLENYAPFEMKDVMDAHALNSKSQINLEQKVYNGEQFFTFSLDPKLVFPVKKGPHTIKPFSLDLKNGIRGFNFKSNTPTYEVIPLPSNAPLSFKGGVGTYSVTRYLEGNKFKQGDVVVLKVEVKGGANIHLLQEPALNLPPSIQVYGDPIIKENYQFGNRGAEGTITYTYNVQLLDSGKLIIPPMKYSYFSLNKEEYITLENPTIDVDVKGDPNFALMTDLFTTDSIDNGGNEVLVDNTIVHKKEKRLDPTLFIVGGLALFSIILLLLLIRKNNKKDQVKQEEEILKEDLKEEVIPYSPANDIKELELLYEQGVDSDLFYKKIQLIIYSLVKQKSQLEMCSVLSVAKSKELLQAMNYNASLVDNVDRILKTCDGARYGMAINIDERNELYTLFNRSISDLSKRS